MATKKKTTNKLTKRTVPSKKKKEVVEENIVEEKVVSKRVKNLNECIKYVKKELQVKDTHKIKFDEHNMSNDILCYECDSVISLGKKCNCSKDKVSMALNEGLCSIKCKNMNKIYMFNNVDRIWFKPDSKL